MRLLIINYEFPPIGGGASNASFFLSKALVDLGHEVHVLTAAFEGNDGLREESGIQVHRVSCLRTTKDRSNVRELFSYCRSALSAIGPLNKNHPFDACICFFAVPCGFIAWLAHRRFGLPYVISQRGADVPTLQPEANTLHWWFKYPRRSVLKSAKCIIANAPGLAELSMSKDPYPVSVIPNGVDTDFFHPIQKSQVEEGPLKLLFVGRLQPQKNLELLFEALSVLEKKSPGQVHLQIVGDGALKSQLKQLSESKGIGHCIEWIHWLDKKQLSQQYRQADAFINPSHYEGLPNTVLEAMASGLPILASDIPGNDQLVEEGLNGWLFKTTDRDRLVEALGQASGDRSNLLKLGQSSRERALTYSWKNVAQQYLELFRSNDS